MNDVVITNRNGVIDVQVSEQVAMTIRTLQQVQIQIQELKNKEEEIKELFAAAMDKTGVSAVDYDGITIQRVAAHTKTTLDNKRLKADYPDLYNEYSKVSTVKASTRITYD